ncbi:glycerol-3-phosphate dehydrogenase/oxidase [Janthinobacterium sp. SUN118]|uniref:glycerol-3-phosphate dehydrogenase/oxidase n=1 Tax=Janthinobacterium sp. SUN118 TaxID=3004100 RepID=UPI0025B152F8|nr:glycerol-3-phosphate dehydrogenase/oxidase [Janthinobacterium sp. SUN118]MDN2712465.1 glycerol-3-phosphate dehydrogenase/oxidase [Janthinobacterium sp. SUN118]
MNAASRRDGLSELLAREWDVLIVGGGITGAGILLEAARRGLKALLVEQRDFAWGTSSRSSKLVHGGLRYLKQGQFAMTRESVHERVALLADAAGLVETQGFAFGDYIGRKPGRRQFMLGLAIYDMMAGRRARRYVDAADFAMLAPHINRDGLRGGMLYQDAKTDDARLVLRVLQEARRHGGAAVNYLGVESLLREGGQVLGATLKDGVGGARLAVRARLVISATGAWADGLRGQVGAPPKLRPLRGSHLLLPAWRLPLAQAVSLMHPRDGRPVFAYPWEGVTLVGTTDVDHGGQLDNEAAITRGELDYLLAALRWQFPQLALGEGDVLATFAGVRPVIDSGRLDPSKEAREHAIWLENGLLTVAGGKLTTFRVIALDALRQAAPLLPGWQADVRPRPIFAPVPPLTGQALLLDGEQRVRLQGRYGAAAQALCDAARDGELAQIPGTQTLWAQLRWGARMEDVQRLEDLLLRRTRLGLQLAGGALAIMPRLRAMCQEELGWSDARWDEEQQRYLALWRSHYSVPQGA